MDVAIKLTLDVGWGGGLAVVEGGGQIDIWLLGHLTHNGTDVALTGNVCDLALPDFATGSLAGSETYGTEFPAAIWEMDTMPVIDATATLSSADPGDVDTLDDNMPQCMVMGGQFDLVRIGDGATCADAVGELP